MLQVKLLCDFIITAALMSHGQDIFVSTGQDCSAGWNRSSKGNRVKLSFLSKRVLLTLSFRKSRSAGSAWMCSSGLGLVVTHVLVWKQRFQYSQWHEATNILIKGYKCFHYTQPISTQSCPIWCNPNIQIIQRGRKRTFPHQNQK